MTLYPELHPSLAIIEPAAKKPDLVTCTVSRALSNRSRELQDNVAHAWNISERFYCDRVPHPDWYARVFAPKKFCPRVVCLKRPCGPAPALHTPPRSRNLPRSSTAGCRDAVKVGDATARLDGTRLHIRSDKLRALRFTRGFLNVYLLHVKHLLSWNLDLLELSDGISTPQGFVNDHILSQVVDWDICAYFNNDDWINCVHAAYLYTQDASKLYQINIKIYKKDWKADRSLWIAN